MAGLNHLQVEEEEEEELWLSLEVVVEEEVVEELRLSLEVVVEEQHQSSPEDKEELEDVAVTMTAEDSQRGDSLGTVEPPCGRWLNRLRLQLSGDKKEPTRHCCWAGFFPDVAQI